MSAVLMITALQQYYKYVAVVNIIVNKIYLRENTGSLKLVAERTGRCNGPRKKYAIHRE
jgi:hypothetical protein